MRFATRVYWAIVNVPFNEGMWYGARRRYGSRPMQFVHDALLATVSLLAGSARYANVSERIVEVPFIFQNLDLAKGSRILDLGCDESKLAIELASLGYQVTGVDLNPYPFSHPNLSLRQGNFLEMDFGDESFDAVVALSSIEHCGLGAYGEPGFERGDRLVAEKIHRILKTGGSFLLTTPFGKRADTPHTRIYDEARLGELLERFTLRKIEYYAAEDLKHWRPAAKDFISRLDFHAGYGMGVVCCVCQK